MIDLVPPWSLQKVNLGFLQCWKENLRISVSPPLIRQQACTAPCVSPWQVQ